MGKLSIYFKKSFFLNVLPVIIINLCLLFPVLFIGNSINFNLIHRVLLNTSSLFIMIANPLYLLIINMIYAIRNKISNYFLNIIFMIIGCSIGLLFWIYYEHILNPALSCHIRRHNPWELFFLFIWNFMIIIIGIIEWIILGFLYKLKWKQTSE